MALVASTLEWISVQLILNIIVRRLSTMQPKNDTFICIVTHEGPLGPVGQVVTVILQTLVIIFELNFPLNFRFVREHNRMT